MAVLKRFQDWFAGARAAVTEPVPQHEPWKVTCTLRVHLRLSRWRTARAGTVVSLPAWQAIGLHRAGKAHVHLGIFAMPDDFGRSAAAQPRDTDIGRDPSGRRVW